jgi:hypothetical protein
VACLRSYRDSGIGAARSNADKFTGDILAYSPDAESQIIMQVNQLFDPFVPPFLLGEEVARVVSEWEAVLALNLSAAETAERFRRAVDRISG